MARHSSIPTWAAPGNSDWKTGIMKWADRQQAERAQSEQRSAEQSSLVRLAYSATRLHKAAIARGVSWPAGEGSPLALATTALASLAKQQGRSR
jgi:hypothetical protein